MVRHIEIGSFCRPKPPHWARASCLRVFLVSLRSNKNKVSHTIFGVFLSSLSVRLSARNNTLWIRNGVVDYSCRYRKRRHTSTPAQRAVCSVLTHKNLFCGSATSTSTAFVKKERNQEQTELNRATVVATTWAKKSRNIQTIIWRVEGKKEEETFKPTT